MSQQQFKLLCHPLSFIKISRLTFAILVASLTGCTNIHCCFAFEHSASRKVNYFVVGFGVVSVPKSESANQILVANSKSFGFMVSNQPGVKASLGYSDSSVVSIPGDINAIAEVSTCPIDNRVVNVEIIKR